MAQQLPAAAFIVGQLPAGGTGSQMIVDAATLLRLEADRRRTPPVIRRSGDTRSCRGSRLSQLVEQHPAPSRNARHHGPNRHIEHLGDLRIRELLDVAQPDGLAKHIRQLIERRTKVRVERVPKQKLLGRFRSPASPSAVASTSSRRELSTSTVAASRPASRSRFLHVLCRIVDSQALQVRAAARTCPRSATP